MVLGFINIPMLIKNKFMNTEIKNWFDRKLSSNLKLRKPFKITEEYSKVSGTGFYAKLTLDIYPCDTFIFETKVSWDAEPESYLNSIIDGILDELIGVREKSVLGMRIVLESIETHPMNSNSLSFYMAAKNAIRKTLNTVHWDSMDIK